MKILHIITGLNIGGAEQALKRLIKSHKSKAEISHMVVSLTDIGSVGKQIEAIGVPVLSIGMQSALSFPLALWQLRKIIKDNKPDIVQTWMYHADFIGGIAAKLAGCKKIIWGLRITDIVKEDPLTTRLICKLSAKLSHYIPQKIVCVAETAKLKHIERGYCAEKMIVITNGFNLAELNATEEQRTILRRECGFEAHHVVIGAVGRFHPIKDRESLIRAAGIVKKELADVRFLLIGPECDPQNEQLTSWLSLSDVSDIFVLLGARCDIPICLAAMDVFCSSSKMEGFPNSVGEAMALKKPCVVTDAGDSAVLVSDCGSVVPVGDSDILAHALLDICKLTSVERNMLGEKSHKRIASTFTSEHSALKFEQLYHSIIYGNN